MWFTLKISKWRFEFRRNYNSSDRKNIYDHESFDKKLNFLSEPNVIRIVQIYDKSTFVFQEQHEDVIRECSSCLELSPRYVKALAKRAKAFKNLGQLEKALNDITAASVLEELRNVDNLQLSESITRELSEQKAKERYANKISRQIPSQHFVETYFRSFTFDIFDTQSAEESGSHLDDVNGFGKAKRLFKNEENDGIEAACSHEIEKIGSESPFYIHALLVRATFRLLSGATKLALEDLEIVISDPSKKATPLQKSNALIKRGSLHMQNQEHFKAMNDFEESVVVANDSVDAHHHRGQVSLY